MHFRQHLEAYTPQGKNETQDFSKFKDFIETNENLYCRSNIKGHITASAWVVNKSLTKTLLVKHAALGIWLMPGGHADGSDDILAMAIREVQEETGVTKLDMRGRGIFDVDVHSIPSAVKHGKQEPEHIHYDIRYLLIADEKEKLHVSDESDDVQWVSFEKVLELHPDWVSGARMIEKTIRLRG